MCLCLQLKSGKHAVRIQRAKEPLLLTYCPSDSAVDQDLRPQNLDQSGLKVLGKTILPSDLGPNMRLDTELYEGIITQTIIEPRVSPRLLMAVPVLGVGLNDYRYNGKPHYYVPYRFKFNYREPRVR